MFPECLILLSLFLLFLSIQPFCTPWVAPGLLPTSSRLLNIDLQAVRSQDFSSNVNFLNFIYQFRHNEFLLLW